MQPRNGAAPVSEDYRGEIQDGSAQPSPRRQNNLSPKVVGILWSALQVGSFTGMSGAIVGSFAGVLRSTSSVLFALASGLQWFTLGTTFWAARGFILNSWSQDELTPRNRVAASAIAGGISGFAGGALRGRRNIIPGTIMFALFGAAGQIMYYSSDAQRRGPAGLAQTTKASWLNSKWSPMRSLSDEEYEAMLREKLLRVNAEIALLDENVSKIRAEEQETLKPSKP